MRTNRHIGAGQAIHIRQYDRKVSAGLYHESHWQPAGRQAAVRDPSARLASGNRQLRRPLLLPEPHRARQGLPRRAHNRRRDDQRRRGARVRFFAVCRIRRDSRRLYHRGRRRAHRHRGRGGDRRRTGQDAEKLRVGQHPRPARDQRLCGRAAAVYHRGRRAQYADRLAARLRQNDVPQGYRASAPRLRRREAAFRSWTRASTATCSPAAAKGMRSAAAYAVCAPTSS